MSTSNTMTSSSKGNSMLVSKNKHITDLSVDSRQSLVNNLANNFDAKVGHDKVGQNVNTIMNGSIDRHTLSWDSNDKQFFVTVAGGHRANVKGVAFSNKVFFLLDDNDNTLTTMLSIKGAMPCANPFLSLGNNADEHISAGALEKYYTKEDIYVPVEVAHQFAQAANFRVMTNVHGTFGTMSKESSKAIMLGLDGAHYHLEVHTVIGGNKKNIRRVFINIASREEFEAHLQTKQVESAEERRIKFEREEAERRAKFEASLKNADVEKFGLL